MTGFERVGDKLILNFEKAGKVVVKAVGDELKIFTTDITEGTQATLNVAGHEARFTVAAAGKEARATIDIAAKDIIRVIQEGERAAKDTMDHAGERIVEVVDTTVNTIPVSFANGLKKAFWRESEFERLQRGIQSEVNSNIFKNKRGILGNLLKFVKGQSQDNLSPLEKADLYVELIKYAGTPSLVDHSKWLFFIIAYSAFKDGKLNENKSYLGLYSFTTSYFNTAILSKIPDEEIRIAFLQNDISELLPEAFRYFDHQKEAFPPETLYLVFGNLYEKVGDISKTEYMYPFFGERFRYFETAFKIAKDIAQVGRGKESVRLFFALSETAYANGALDKLERCIKQIDSFDPSKTTLSEQERQDLSTYEFKIQLKHEEEKKRKEEEEAKRPKPYFD